MSHVTVQAYGINHAAIEAPSVAEAVAIYTDVFNLEIKYQDDDHAFLFVGKHQFLAIARCEKKPARGDHHFGILVRDESQIESVRQKVEEKYGLKLYPEFRCDFRDPFGNRIQVADLHDESLVWLLPYQEVQTAGIVFTESTTD